jgi:hypothetical protein
MSTTCWSLTFFPFFLPQFPKRRKEKKKLTLCAHKAVCPQVGDTGLGVNGRWSRW